MNGHLVVKILYTNWRGEKGERLIRPEKIFFGKTPYHFDEQWLLKAYDLEKQAERDFAMKGIESWQRDISFPDSSVTHREKS